jgi:V/A-type H+-transporting ATPase subunit A
VSPLQPGVVVRVAGPLVEVEDLPGLAVAELVHLGEAELPAEVVSISSNVATLQAYEYTGGLRPGDVARRSAAPLSALLGPHLLGGVFDGLLRPLSQAQTWLAATGSTSAPDVEWLFTPADVAGDRLHPGAVLGTVALPGPLEYRVQVPPGAAGRVSRLRPHGRVLGQDTVALVGGTPVSITQRWPLRQPRPIRARLGAVSPLLTGQRVLDLLFPIARGSSAAVPGGFGTGKTMLLQQVAKWGAADVIVYVGCGERGNEMADVVTELAELVDPRSGEPLSRRTVVVANTSNMPMMAREASIYTGVAVAEFFRDMGLDTVVIADSTSRWAEALREFASRSGALPAEEGYPAELPSALAAFYERSGAVDTLGGEHGSVTVIGAVSPPGGDVTEPVTANTERFVRCVWSLDRDLAYSRHYPAVSWSGSFSRDVDRLEAWYGRQGDPGWAGRRRRAAALLSESDRLADLADLVGVAAMPASERVLLLGGRLLRQAALQQNALSANDVTCSAAKGAAIVDAVLAVTDRCLHLVERGAMAVSLEEVDYSPLLRARDETGPEDAQGVRDRRDIVLAALETVENERTRGHSRAAPAVGGDES